VKPGYYVKAAFLFPLNLVALGGATLASALTGDPQPALIALGAEGLYLGVASSLPPFRRYFERRAGAVSSVVRAGSLMDELAPSQREHYLALEELRNRILSNYRKLPGGGVLAASSEQRLDALLTNFLRLVGTLNAYRKYLNAADREAVEQEAGALKAEVATESNPRLREIKQKRAEILGKRVQRFRQAEESREIVSHQLAGIEDLLRLTHEQSIAIRDPESITRQLDALTVEVQATEETVREMEQFMEIAGDAGAMPDLTRIRT
jgi:hypothetical protein